MNRVEDLVEKIRYHNEKYYNEDSPEISDFEYDKLIKDLKSLDPSNPVFQELGKPIFGIKIKHKIPMGSLLKAHTGNEVESLNATLVSMPKIDGLSLSVRYVKGIMVAAVTRGDGYEGEDVFANAQQIKNLPQQINYPGEVEVRGEVYVERSWFYSKGQFLKTPPFKNPRNYAAGSLKQDDFKITATRNLSFISYRLMNGVISSKEKELDTLRRLGFEIPHYDVITCKLDLIEKIIEKYGELRKTLHYDMDGIVFWINDTADFQSRGESGVTPRGAIAFKFDTDKVPTTILDIEWETSRTGKVVPVMHLKPVEVAGTTVKRCTLNNPEFIAKNDVMIGDEILIEKANEIIPKLVSVVNRPKNRHLNTPTNCPSCQTPLIRKGAYLVCEGKNCPRQVVGNLLHFFKALNIKGFSIKSIERITESNILDEKKLFELDKKDYLSIGFGPTQSEQLYQILNNIKISELEFLCALGIEKAGHSNWEKVLNQFEFTNIVSGKLDLGDYNEVCGTSTAKSMFYGILDQQDFINEVLPYIEIDAPTASATVSQKLQHKTFCITGTLSKKRAEVEKIITENGGLCQGVNKGLDFLIVGSDPGSKLTKANSLGVKIISEQELYKML